MNQVIVREIDEETLYAINTCIAQLVDNDKPDVDEFYVINVWFPEPSRRILRRECKDGTFTLFVKLKQHYTIPDIIEKAQDIWDKGYVPIEIVQSEGCLFYGIPKSVIRQRTVRTHTPVLMEN